MDQPSEPTGKPITIKKYANRRLYNTATSSYVTLDLLCQMVKDGIEFEVFDAKTGEEITRAVLTQIIVEEEAKGQNLLPISFLRQLIRFYDDNLQAFLPHYLEVSMDNFTRNQHQMRGAMKEAFGGLFPFNQFEEMGRQNLALIQNAFNMFGPNAAGAKPGAASGADTNEIPRNAEASGKAPPEDDIEGLKTRLDAMQRRLDEIARKDSPSE